jgi:exodeoxyribonuclease VII small subunit
MSEFCQTQHARAGPSRPGRAGWQIPPGSSPSISAETGRHGKELKSDRRRAWYAGVEAENKLAKLPFEAALAKLEAIVESMESGQVPLAELVAKFEEGNRLLKQCEARLKDAEMKIEQLKKQKDGVAFVPFDPERGS